VDRGGAGGFIEQDEVGEGAAGVYAEICHEGILQEIGRVDATGCFNAKAQRRKGRQNGPTTENPLRSLRLCAFALEKRLLNTHGGLCASASLR
jgi:hypothetical protein